MFLVKLMREGADLPADDNGGSHAFHRDDPGERIAGD